MSMLSTAQISRTRATQKLTKRVNAPGETLAELVQYRGSLIRSAGCNAWTMYSLLDFPVITQTATILPIMCDHMIDSLARFIKTGVANSNSGSLQVRRLVGDATHDETHQRLKKLRIGYAGCHFPKSEWQTTMVPSIEVLCHDETQDAVDLALRAISHVATTPQTCPC